MEFITISHFIGLNIMSFHDYHFLTHWRVKASPEEVYQILEDASSLANWWPAVYLKVFKLQGGKHPLYDVYTKGWLPYILRWQFSTVKKVPYKHIELEAWGDLYGKGVWSFFSEGKWVNITYDWNIKVNKPLLRHLSFFLKPVFYANHQWAMAKGEESLKLELLRRKARAQEELKDIPEPPGPTTTSSLPLLLGLVGVSFVMVLGIQSIKRFRPG